jgi:hypothetical protein
MVSTSQVRCLGTDAIESPGIDSSAGRAGHASRVRVAVPGTSAGRGRGCQALRQALRQSPPRTRVGSGRGSWAVRRRRKRESDPVARSINEISTSIDDEAHALDGLSGADNVSDDPHNGPRCGDNGPVGGGDVFPVLLDADRGGSRGSPYCQAIDRCPLCICRASRCIEWVREPVDRVAISIEWGLDPVVRGAKSIARACEWTGWTVAGVARAVVPPERARWPPDPGAEEVYPLDKPTFPADPNLRDPPGHDPREISPRRAALPICAGGGGSPRGRRGARTLRRAVRG